MRENQPAASRSLPMRGGVFSPARTYSSETAKEASRLLASLQQGRRSVADYSVEFRTLAATSGWNAEALSARFLEGLRESLKDELYAREVPDCLDDLIALAIRLDARRELRRRARTGEGSAASWRDSAFTVPLQDIRLIPVLSNLLGCPFLLGLTLGASALVDSGAEGNFMDEEWARIHDIPVSLAALPSLSRGSTVTVLCRSPTLPPGGEY
ncbi:hypothetical protein QQF64_034593 [Cirrhinus molitorella]|uniref:Retrotransposon gag domain-containing protein n=1 Tax=Cirrhinus molitorella TaxID=172907 RepID=A0ABR3L137_9TELE